MSISLEDQVAIVTGAGRGLGRAYALELARLGAKVVVNDLGGSVDGTERSATPAEEVCDEIRKAGGEALANFESVATMAGGQAMVQAALDRWGRLDAIVCNAGILRDRTLHNMSEDDWDSVFAVHIKGCFTVMRAAWPVFRERRYGRVVLATSSSGLYGNFGQANYAAAKAAMIGLMNTAKLEGEKYNIAVNLIGPSAMTRMTQGLVTGEVTARMSAEHVAPVVAYLASSECQDSGLIIEAIGGHYNRAAVVKGRGVRFDANERKDVDWVAAHWSEITSLEGAEPMWAILESLAKHKAARK
jgi:NAD(P)-dependent dehydrogenase (short-subunit alcohol dehydrogenase family)